MNPDNYCYIDHSPPETGENGTLKEKLLSIQPNISVRGWPTEAGSVALEGFRALEDATVIERLREAGAKITGSTRMSELGFGLAGDTAPLAISGGDVDIALMTDTMGEARLAASIAGAFGFKPSYGLVSRYGLIGLVPSMECYGIMAKKPEDIGSVMGVIAGCDNYDLSMPEYQVPDFSQIGKPREPKVVIGTVRECMDTLEPDEIEAFNETLSQIRKMGLKIRECNLTDFDLFRTVHNIIGSVEASSSGGKYDGVRYGHRARSTENWNEMYLKSRAESFGLLIKTYLFQGAYFQFENYSAFEDACRIRARLVKQMEELFNEVDFLVLPTRRGGLNVSDTSTIDEVYDAFCLSLPANVTGLPAIHIPGSVFQEENDLGLQLIGPRLGDAHLLSVAATLSHLIEGGK